MFYCICNVQNNSECLQINSREGLCAALPHTLEDPKAHGLKGLLARLGPPLVGPTAALLRRHLVEQTIQGPRGLSEVLITTVPALQNQRRCGVRHKRRLSRSKDAPDDLRWWQRVRNTSYRRYRGQFVGGGFEARAGLKRNLHSAHMQGSPITVLSSQSTIRWTRRAQYWHSSRKHNKVLKHVSYDA